MCSFCSWSAPLWLSTVSQTVDQPILVWRSDSISRTMDSPERSHRRRCRTKLSPQPITTNQVNKFKVPSPLQLAVRSVWMFSSLLCFSVCSRKRAFPWLLPAGPRRRDEWMDWFVARQPKYENNTRMCINYSRRSERQRRSESGVECSAAQKWSCLFYVSICISMFFL